MNVIPYSDEIVGVLPENAFLKDQVMVKVTRISQRSATVPILKDGRTIGTKKVMVTVGEDFGAQSMVDEDLLIQRQIKNGFDFSSEPQKGGYILDFGNSFFWTRKAKPTEFHSINAYLTREDNVIYNHTFIQQQYWKDWVAQNNVSQWRMPFSPESPSTFAVSWQMIDAEGGKWECVPATQQKPYYIPRLTHHLISNPKASSVNVINGDAPSYNPDTHTFTITAGCKIRLYWINSPMGQKEFSDEVEFDIDTNKINLI